MLGDVTYWYRRIPLMPALKFPRALYLAAAAGSVIAAAVPSDRATRLVKPALMPLLLASNPQKSALLVAGLAGGWVGDIILMGKDSRSADPGVRARNLKRGSAAFLVNQLAYHALLLRSGARPTWKNAALRAPMILGGVGLAAMKNPAALPAAGGYGSALALTSILAQDSSSKAALGGNLFVLSDALILGRLTLLKEGSRIDALTDAAVMATYTAAQFLLVDGVTNSTQSRPKPRF